MTTAEVVAYCLSGFGLGYAGGYLHKIWNRVLEVCD